VAGLVAFGVAAPFRECGLFYPYSVLEDQFDTEGLR
jgi:hypothetical protein